MYRSWFGNLHWFGKDSRSCNGGVDFHALSQLYVIKEESSIKSKSCPLLLDGQEYKLMSKPSIVNISHVAKEEEDKEVIETKPRENVAKKLTEKIFSVFKKENVDSAMRVLPKDSVAVCRKRIKTAASLRRWQEENPCNDPCSVSCSVLCSVPSYADKAGEIQREFALVTPVQQELEVPPSILAKTSSTDKKNTSKPKVISANTMSCGVMPNLDENVNQILLEEVEKEIVSTVMEAGPTNVNTTEVHGISNTMDSNLHKPNSDKDLNTFRVMKAPGKPLPLKEDIRSGKDFSSYASGNLLINTEYQFKPNPRSQQINRVTSYGEPSQEDLRKLEDRLTTLSITTAKSLEVLSQIFQQDGERVEQQDGERVKQQHISGFTNWGTCGCLKPSCDPVRCDKLCNSNKEPRVRKSSFDKIRDGILVTGGVNSPRRGPSIQWDGENNEEPAIGKDIPQTKERSNRSKPESTKEPSIEREAMNYESIQQQNNNNKDIKRYLNRCSFHSIATLSRYTVIHEHSLRR